MYSRKKHIEGGTVQVEEEGWTVLEPPGSEFVFYKVTQTKSSNKRTQFLAGRVQWEGT